MRPVKISSVAASRHAVFALTTDGNLLFAQIRRCADLAVHDVELHPLKELIGVRIAQVATRFGQAYAVTSDGEVYAWGMRSGDPHRPELSCSMGFGKVATLLHPTRIPCFGSGPGATPIRCVASGISHSLFVSIYGEVYSVGRAEDGQLGLASSALRPECHHVMKPAKVSFDTRPSPMVVAVAAGARHSLFLAATGEVWGCGLAKYGALPMTCPVAKRPMTSSVWVPRLLDRLQCFCTGIAAGISISFFVGEGGEVLLSGTARQTPFPFGRSINADPWAPYRIPGLRQIEQVSVSMELSSFQWEHAIFVRQDGSIYAWGHLGHGEFSIKEGQKSLCGLMGNVVGKASNSTLSFCNSVVRVNNWPGLHC